MEVALWLTLLMMYSMEKWKFTTKMYLVAGWSSGFMSLDSYLPITCLMKETSVHPE